MDFTSGTQIGKYTLGRKLGQGGFGLVFAAQDAPLGREVALKFLKQEHTRDQAVLKRFLQEARAAGKIVHPGIVTVLECGQLTETNSDADGTAYIAMELLHGESLTERLARCGKVPIEAAMEIGRQAAAALEAAHRAEIVHRDMKPDNILLVPDPTVPGGERVKILDFGIAKLAHTSANTVQTESMMVFGTPRYMSPELCKSAACVDHRSDIYQLGCILFELVAGRPPFIGVTGELIAQHLLVPPPALKTFVPSVSPALARLIDQMLAKDPESRPPSMVVIERRLEACLAPASPRETLGIPEVTRPHRATTPQTDDDKDPNETTTLSSMARARSRSEGGRSPQVVFGGALAVITMLVVVVAVARGSDAPVGAGMPEAGTVKMQVEAPPEPPASSSARAAPPAPQPESPAERAQREAANLDVAVREAARLDEAKPEAGETAKVELSPAPRGAQVDRAEREVAAAKSAAKIDAPPADAAKREAAKAEAAKREQMRVAAADRAVVGTLALSVKPACDIFIDGKQLGTQATERELVLPAGRHRVGLVSTEHGLRDSFFVEVRAGAIERIAKEFNVADKPRKPDPPPADRTKSRDATNAVDTVGPGTSDRNGL